MKRFRILIIVGVVIAVLVGGGGWLARKRANAAKKPITVRVEPVKRGELIEFVSAPGEIEPKIKVEISAKFSARVVSMPFDEGDQVTAGDPNADPPIPPSVLLRLDSKDLKSQLLSAQAGRDAQAAQIEVEKARIAGQKASQIGLEASLKQARTDLDRQRKLFASGDVTQVAFDLAKLKVDDLVSQFEAAKLSLQAAGLNLEVLRHNVVAADARIDQAKQTLSYTIIDSPIDGVITRVNAEVGEMVMTGTMNNPGTVIMVVGDLSRMLVVAQVDEADVGKLACGQRATVYVEAYPDREFTGVVHTIALSHDQTFTRAKFYKTEILLDPTDITLHSGLTAHVDIETRKHVDVLKVPTQTVLGKPIDELPLAIRDSNEVNPTKTYATLVFRFIDGKAVATPVKIGRSDLTHTIIESGLSEADTIVVGPYTVLEKLRHDQPIQDERTVQAAKSGKDKTPAQTDDVNEPSDPNKREEE